EQRGAAEAVRQRLFREDPREACRQQTIDRLHSRILEVEDAIQRAESRMAAARHSLAARLSQVEDAYRCRRAALSREFQPAVEAQEDALRGLRENLDALDAQKTDLERHQRSAIARLDDTGRPQVSAERKRAGIDE